LPVMTCPDVENVWLPVTTVNAVPATTPVFEASGFAVPAGCVGAVVGLVVGLVLVLVVGLVVGEALGVELGVLAPGVGVLGCRR